MTKKREEQGNGLYGAQVGIVELIEPESGTMHVRQREGKRTAYFVSDEDLTSYRLTRALFSQLEEPGIRNGYALIDRRRNLVFCFRKGGDNPPARRPRVHVGDVLIKVPWRLHDAVPEVGGALVAVHLHPTTRPPGEQRKAWAAGSLKVLSFSKPMLIESVVRRAPFRPYFEPFVRDYLSFCHREAMSLNARSKQEHASALLVISESQELADLRDWALSELRRMKDGKGSVSPQEPPASLDSTPPTQRQKLPDIKPAENDEKTSHKPPTDVPITRLDLTEGDSDDDSDPDGIPKG